MSSIKSWGAVLIFAFAMALDAQVESFPNERLVGHWAGKGQIIVQWCAQDSLSFDLTIHPDGLVTGKIGDASITQGKIRLNAWFLRVACVGK